MLKALRGTKDILPSEARTWQFIEDSARYIFSIYGYNEIRTPVIEEASLFIKSIGDITDIVQKEMYVFTDRGGRSIALRPEATASVVRSYIEHSMGYRETLAKLYYIGPMFRSERPQKGRQRQFHQLGVEAIGSSDPLLDAEVISLAAGLLKKINVKGFSVKLNSLGCLKDKKELIKKYKDKTKPYLKSLCDECRARWDKNVLRIFDCKNPECAEAVKSIEPKSSLCGKCSAHFLAVRDALDRLGMKYTVDEKIVRGLDYYTGTVFEIVQGDLGAKDAICAGGRYDNLIQDMGGKDTPAVGFAFGIERLALAVKDTDMRPDGRDVYIAVPDKSLRAEAFKLLDDLRRSGFSCDMDYEDRSLKAQLKKAEKLQAKCALILGEKEFSEKKAVVKDMEKRQQSEVEFAADTIKKKIHGITGKGEVL